MKFVIYSIWFSMTLCVKHYVIETQDRNMSHTATTPSTNREKDLEVSFGTNMSRKRLNRSKFRNKHDQTTRQHFYSKRSRCKLRGSHGIPMRDVSLDAWGRILWKALVQWAVSLEEREMSS